MIWLGLLPCLLGASQPASIEELLDSHEDEWVADGHEVIVEVVVDPLEYGEPVREDNCIGGQGFFAWNEDGSQSWRIVLVLWGGVVVLEEGEPERIYEIDAPIHLAKYSRTGEYIALTTGRNEGVLVNAETGETRDLPSTQVVISDAGTAAGFGTFRSSGVSAYVFFDWDLGEVGAVLRPFRSMEPAISADGSLFLVRELDGETGFQVAFSARGTRLWQCELGSSQGWAIPSDDGRVVLVASREWSGVLDGGTGEPLWGCECEPLSFLPNVLSPSGLCWAARSGDTLLSGSCLNGDTIAVHDFSGSGWRNHRPCSVSDSARILGYHWTDGATRRRLSLTDRDGSVLWLSREFPRGSLDLMVNRNYETYLVSSPKALSADGTRILYTDYEKIYVIRISPLEG